MPVSSVFVSSVQRGFEKYREAARSGVERVGMHPLMAEDQPASPSAPRRALLGEVAASDVYLLVLGARYGEPDASGRSPTEDEYQQAVKTNRPIIVMVQELEMEAAQRDFLERVRGTWGKGILYETFRTPEELTLAVVTALSRWRGGLVEMPEEASARATALARRDGHSSTGHTGVAARLALVPVVQVRLLGPIELEDETLADQIAGYARDSGLVPQRIGLSASVTSTGIKLNGTPMENFVPLEVDLLADGSLVTQASVQEGTSLFSGSLVDPAQFERFVFASGAFARTALDRIDPDGQVTRVAAVACIPNVQYKGWGEITGSSMRMSSTAFEAVAPQPARVYPRGQLGDDRFTREIRAAMRRVFADAGAVH